MKKKIVIISLLIIIFLLAGGIAAWKITQNGEQKTNSSNQQRDNDNSPDNPQPNPSGKLTQAELEKYLLEKRLDLQKYFVFNLGNELIPRGQPEPYYKNECKLRSKVSQDLTKLTTQYEKKLKEAGYWLGLNTQVEGRIYYGRLDKEIILFMGQNFTNFDKEEWWGEKIDEKINNGKDKFIILEKDNEFQNIFFKKDFVDSEGKVWFGYTNYISLRMKSPTTIICESKEKALEIIKNDPALEGKV